MSDLERGERLQIMLSMEELDALETWRFAKRMPSRAAAVRELLRRGLAAEGFELGGNRKKSSEYGMLSGDGAANSQADGSGNSRVTASE